MKIVTGYLDLSSATTAWSTPIDVSRNADNGDFCLWSHIQGDFGKTGGSCYVEWTGSYVRSGATYIKPTGANKVRIAGTSVTGPDSNGTDAATFAPDLFPFLRLRAIRTAAAATCTAGVTYALMHN